MNISTIPKKGYLSQKMVASSEYMYLNVELPVKQVDDEGYSAAEPFMNFFFLAYTPKSSENNYGFVVGDEEVYLVQGFVDLIDCQSNYNSQINKALESYKESAYYIDTLFNKELPGGNPNPDDGDDDDDSPATAGPTTAEPTLPKLRCPYEKVSYRFIQSGDEYEIRPSSNNLEDITYVILCNGTEPIDNRNGVFTYKSDKISTTSYRINCSKSGYENGRATIVIKTIEYKPSISMIKYPGFVNKSELFNASITLAYPPIENLNDTDNEDSENLFTEKEFVFKMSLVENDYWLILSPDETVKGKLDFKFNNYNISNSDIKEGIFNLILKFEGNSTDNEIMLSATRNIQVINKKVCEEEFGFDADHVCCKRVSPGELCNSVTTIYNFAGEGSDQEFGQFKDAFVKSIARIFNGTHFFDYDDTQDRDFVQRKIKILVKYNTDRNNTKTRLLQGDGGINLDINPLDVIEAVMKSIGPAQGNDNDGNNEENIFDDNIKQAIANLGMDTKQLTEAVITTKQELEDSGLGFAIDTIETSQYPVDTKEKVESEKDPWEKEYWWVILIICIVVVLLIVISVVCIYSHSKKTKEMREIQSKQLKIKEKEIPVEKIVDVNSVAEEDLYVPYYHDVIIEGYLLKRGRKNLGKWQQRYCVLYSNLKTFRIYESMTPSYGGNLYLNEKQDIPIDCYNGIEYKDGSNEFTLVLKIRDSSFKTYEAGDIERKIHFKCEGDNKVEEAMKWVDCFRDYKNKKPKAVEAWIHPVIINRENQAIVVATDKAEEKKNQSSVESALERKNRKAVVENKKKPFSSFIPASLMVKVGVYSKPK